MYTTPEIGAIFDQQNVLDQWVQVELAVLVAQAERGLIPKGWARYDAPNPSVEDWRKATAETGHEVLGFLQAWGHPHAHIGLTSSDVTDTALAMRIRQARSVVCHQARDLRAMLRAVALQLWDTPKLGRTHGQPAVQDSAGHRWADLAFMVDRARERAAYDSGQPYGKLSGPIGGYHHTGPEVEYDALAMLGVYSAPCATQIVPRDGLATWAAAMAQLVTCCEAIGIEIRLGSHESIQEYSEGAPTGSSAMPHKANPARSERLTGLGRMARSMVGPIMEGMVQWHERDLGHSSVEREYVPQLAGLAHFALREATDLVSSLQAHPGAMAAALTEHVAETSSHGLQTMLQREDGSSHDDARRLALQYPDYQFNNPPNLDAVRERLLAL